jgi:hypothetical protein
MKECDKRKKPYKQQTSYDLYIFEKCLDILLLRPSLHFTTLPQLHFTPLRHICRHFTSSHLNFTQLHFTALLVGLTPFKFSTAPFYLTSLHFTSIYFTAF